MRVNNRFRNTNSGIDMKLLPLLLLLCFNVAAQEVKTDTVPGIPVRLYGNNHVTYYCGKPGCTVLHMKLSESKILPGLDIVISSEKEISLQRINDSLTAKIQQLLEYYELSCPIIENLYLSKRAGMQIVRSSNSGELTKAVRRYYKRYKIITH